MSIELTVILFALGTSAKLLTALMARTWTVYVVGFFTHSNGYGFQNPPNSPFQSVPCLHVLSFAEVPLIFSIFYSLCFFIFGVKSTQNKSKI